MPMFIYIIIYSMAMKAKKIGVIVVKEGTKSFNVTNISIKVWKIHAMPFFIPQMNTESRQCQEKVDIVFLVDTSGSVGRRNFNKQQDFLANVVDELPIASDKVRVSEVKYGHRIFFEFSLTEHTDKEDLKDALGNVRYRSFQNTRTGRGIRYVVNNYKGIIEARDDSILILIVVTDGKSQDNVEAPAQAAKDEGFLVIALGVGRNVDENELKQIASEDDLVILADSFNALDTVVKDITDLILECRKYTACVNYAPWN